MATKHAVLSASSSERWLNCPPSARLCEAYEDKGSDYAAEGTDAHTLCEFRLKRALGIPTENPIENLSWYNEEMEDCAAGYAAYVTELLETAKQTCIDPVVLVEQRVDFSRWVQDGFGTADCIVIADGVLNICDYKNGQGCLVLAEWNPQMMLYALGALEIFDGIYDIDTVRMTILNEEGIRTRRGYTWHPSAIRLILENEKYAGDLKLQKIFVRDHLTKEKVVNHGELPIYWVENDHEPIISREQFQAIQLRLKKQS